MPKDLEGLTNATVRSLERVPVRTRESNVTRSAWRMEVDCDAGHGTIAFIDEEIYRGDGIFLGDPQERLAAIYHGMMEKDDTPPFELQQLG